MRASAGFVVTLSIVIALAGCAQAWAGPLPSATPREKTAGDLESRSSGVGLTPQQEVAMAAVDEAGDAQYGELSEESQIIIVGTVCIVAVVVIVAVAS